MQIDSQVEHDAARDDEFDVTKEVEKAPAVDDESFELELFDFFVVMSDSILYLKLCWMLTRNYCQRLRQRPFHCRYYIS